MIREYPLVQKLLSLELPASDFAIFGSGPMFARGLKTELRDLDVVVCREAWDRVQQLGPVAKREVGEVPYVALDEGKIEIDHGWSWGNWSPEEIVDSAEIIEGIRFAGLDKVITYKKLAGRPKDLEDIKIIENYLTSKNV